VAESHLTPTLCRWILGRVKKVGCFSLATAALVLVAVLPAYAQSSGRQGFAFGGSRGGHGTHHFHSGIEFFFGVRPPVWWWSWGYPYDLSPHYYYSDDSHSYYTHNPSDPYFPYFYVYPGQMVVQPAPPADTRQGQPAEPYYWYYCEGAQGYYPHVQQCPNGWMKVVPPN
jgi:hypothetical protein